MPVYFQLPDGTGRIEASNPSPPYRAIRSPRQVIQRTVGRNLFVTQRGQEGLRIEIRWNNIITAERTAVVDFFRTVVNWSAKKFTFIDHFGESHENMQYLSGIPESDEESERRNRWVLALVMTQVPG